MHFGFIPPYGRTLEPNQQVSWSGSLMDGILQRTRGLPDTRLIKCLENALDRDHQIQVISTPSPILFDAGANAPKMLTVNNGTPGSSNPCFAA